MRSVRYHPLFHTIIEVVEILDGRVSKYSVEQVRNVINNLLHLNMESFHSQSVFPLAFGS